MSWFSLLGFGRCEGTTYATEAASIQTGLATSTSAVISEDCSYVLAGDGFAVLIQHNIFSFLYSVDGPNPDLHAFGCTAPAIRLITGTWTKVDTPSVSSRQG